MPTLATVVVLSLGVGVGINVAVFSWVQAFLFKPLPGVADAASFQFVEPRAESGTFPGVSWLEYRDLRERLNAFEDIIAFRSAPLNLGDAGRTERGYSQLISGNFFSVLGLKPALGRFVLPEETARPGGEPVVVVSHDFWQTRLAASPRVLGQRLRANGVELVIVGVAPAGFQGTILGLNFDLWTPATMAPLLFKGSTELENRGARGYAVMGRLVSGVNIARAEVELETSMRELAQLHPESNQGLTGEVRPFWRTPRGPQQMLMGSLLVLQALMLLLLLAVCGNTANLLLARATTRQREVGVHAALGAGPGRIVRLLLAESLLLALGGAILGVAIAAWGTNALRAAPMIGAFPIRFQTDVDAIGLAVGFALALGCGLLFGLAPAVQLARVDPQQSLRAAGQATSRGRMRGGLIAAEVALALVVLVAAALFPESFRETREIDPGFRRDGILLAAYDLSAWPDDEAAERTFAAEVLRRLRATPGVEGAAISSSMPLDIHGLPLRPFVLEGRARDDRAPDRALSNVVTPGYFTTLGIALVAGSDFAPLDDRASPPQVVVNEEFVRRYLGQLESLGRRLEARGTTYLITGVVKNSLYESFSEPPTPIVYYSYRDRPLRSGEIHVRSRTGTESSVSAEIRRVVHELDPSLAIYDVRTMAEHVEKNLFLRRIPARMFVVLGPMLLALAAIGIYGVVSYSVARRRAEIGVRLALGATARRVISQIVRESLRSVLIGAAIGWFLVFIVYIHLVRGGLDPWVFAGVPALLLLVATLASWVPARRAAGVDPLRVLRQE
jgi:predicted permease